MTVETLLRKHNQMRMQWSQDRGLGCPPCASCGDPTEEWWSYCAMCGYHIAAGTLGEGGTKEK